MCRLMLALALVLTACSRDDSPTASAVISGSYRLSTVNDRPLPYVTPDGVFRSISAGRITFVSNDSLDFSTTGSFGWMGPATQVTRHGYNRTSSGLSVSFGTFSATITGDSRAIQLILPGGFVGFVPERYRYVK